MSLTAWYAVVILRLLLPNNWTNSRLVVYTPCTEQMLWLVFLKCLFHVIWKLVEVYLRRVTSHVRCFWMHN